MTDASFHSLIQSWSDDPDIRALPALLAPSRQPISFSSLQSQVMELVERLYTLGLCKGSRVALVLPDGPEMAACFLAVVSAMTAAPLNPAYRESEFDFYLQDLEASAVILPAGRDSPARAAARKRGVPVFEISMPAGGASGTLTLSGTPSARVPDLETPAANIALLLHTSGTTARPKIVPLPQRNLLASARNIVATLHLTPADRCLNLMPLFHIHGLVAGLLAPLSAGCGVVCPPGFQAPSFFAWLDEFSPTWYTAVPTMHQSILARAPLHPDAVARSRLRFVRSSSSPLAPAVLAELEKTFHAPVVEAYGMTEAAHQIASNPLPPAVRKPGTVGLPAGPEFAIMQPDSPAFAETGAVGEIVIRGQNVISAYLNNPVANASAFTAGWFRTGDLGSIDPDGYLTIRGRLKEIINRGGEKISPREIDEVLLAHPNIRQAVAFAVPDPRLGELVAAAVVLVDPGRATTPDELRRFVALHLADYKVPVSISILAEIPKGPTGKIQRIGLAEKLGVISPTLTLTPADTVPLVKPGGDVEQTIHAFWAEILAVGEFGVQHGFLSLGGDSVLAARIASRIQSAYEIPFSLIDFFNFPTVSGQAILVQERVLAQVLQLTDTEAASRLHQYQPPTA